MSSRFQCRFLLLPPSLILLTLLLGPSHAQSMTETVSMTGVSSSNLQTTLSIARPSSSLSGSFITSFSVNTTNSTSTPSSTNSPPPMFPSGGYHDQRGEGVFNYYFLILAVFGVLIAVFLWWVRKRRKRRKEQTRLSGQNALARDMDGWITTRRWMYGRRRHNQESGVLRREEGLDENGEAPPPYRPKHDVTVAQGTTSPARDAPSGLVIPMRTLSRDHVDIIRPPEYQETVSRQTPTTPRPSTTSNRTIRLDDETASDTFTRDRSLSHARMPDG